MGIETYRDVIAEYRDPSREGKLGPSQLRKILLNCLHHFPIGTSQHYQLSENGFATVQIEYHDGVTKSNEKPNLEFKPEDVFHLVDGVWHFNCWPINGYFTHIPAIKMFYLESRTGGGETHRFALNIAQILTNPFVILGSTATNCRPTDTYFNPSEFRWQLHGLDDLPTGTYR